MRHCSPETSTLNGQRIVLTLPVHFLVAAGCKIEGVSSCGGDEHRADRFLLRPPHSLAHGVYLMSPLSLPERQPRARIRCHRYGYHNHNTNPAHAGTIVVVCFGVHCCFFLQKLANIFLFGPFIQSSVEVEVRVLRSANGCIGIVFDTL